MGLRAQAATDLGTILGDTDGFGWPITVTDPAGTSAALTGFSADIGVIIDVETGVAVAGRRASVALAIAALTAGGLGVPKGTSDGATKPWVVAFNDIAGTSHTFKVCEAHPDTTIGIVTCRLEAYVTT